MQQAQSNLDKEALSFMQALADELAEGKVELPSYPEAAMRVQRALSADEVDLDLIFFKHPFQRVHCHVRHVQNDP